MRIEQGISNWSRAMTAEASGPGLARCVDAPEVDETEAPQAGLDATPTDATVAGGGRLARLPLADRALFLRIERANELVESGGRGAVESRLVTTAGPGSPASIGRSQLLVPLQVDLLGRLARTEEGRTSLRAHGLDPAELTAIDARGDAALRWYDAVVRGRFDPQVPFGAEDLRALRRSLREGSIDAFVAEFGARFEADTGIPASELRSLAETRLLRDPAIASRYRRLRAELRDDTRALDALVAERPALASVRDRIGDDRSMSYFLRRPRRNGEHRAAWYTRAVRTDAASYERLRTALRTGLDRETSRMHALRTFERARALVDAMPDASSIDPSRRARLIAQLDRMLHGLPSYFQARFGTPSNPKVGSTVAIEAVLRGLDAAHVSTVEGDQGASVRAFTARYDAIANAPTTLRPVR